MSTYAEQHIQEIVPLIRHKAAESKLSSEDQEDLAQDTVVEVLTSTADDLRSMLRTMNRSFRKNLSRISRQNDRLSLRSVPLHLIP